MHKGIAVADRWNVQRFRGGLVFEAHRLVYHSTLGLRVIKQKKKKRRTVGSGVGEGGAQLGAGPRENQFPHKSVNLFFILVIVKDKLTDLRGS